ncbi:MAG TPA: hypothetical protein VL442_16285 [Mucilaginibacter sp.]|nr:hypothetical protein [Mucilaginibacter sp.]
MKKIIFAAAIILGCFSIKTANAQVHLSVGINIGSQPEWGPTGYDHVDYYYMPDIDAYYDINAHQYVYFNNNVWVHSASLPPRYANYDVYHGYKVVVNERTPWVHNDVYRRKYASYKGRRDQAVIRDSHDEKYKNHWKGEHGRGRDHDDHHRH